MSEETDKGVVGLTTAGVVRNGVILPNMPLPEGARVIIKVYGLPMEFTPEEQEEFDWWNQLSDRAMDVILRMEAEESSDEKG